MPGQGFKPFIGGERKKSQQESKPHAPFKLQTEKVINDPGSADKVALDVKITGNEGLPQRKFAGSQEHSAKDPGMSDHQSETRGLTGVRLQTRSIPEFNGKIQGSESIKQFFDEGEKGRG